MHDAVMHETSTKSQARRPWAGVRSGGSWERPVAWAVAVAASLAVWGLLGALIVALL